MGDKEVISRRGLAKKHAALDYEVWQWKTKLENARGMRRVTKNEVQAHALAAYKIAGITNFKASDGWYRRWRARWQNTDVAVTDDVEKKEENETADVINEAHLKSVCQDQSKKRKVSEVELACVEGEIKNTEECSTKVARRLCKDKLQLFSCEEEISFLSSATNTTETHVNSEEETRNVLGIVANSVPVVSHLPTSGLDSLLLSVNFVELQQSKSKKRLKVNLSNVKEPLKTHSVCSFATFTEVSDSSSCVIGLDTNICDKIQLAAKQYNEIGTNPVDSQQVAFVKPSEQGRALEENESINRECVEQAIRFIETSEGNSWTFASQGHADVSSAADSPVCSQSDSGISIPSSSGNLEATDSFILSPIFEQSDMDFSENEHELFCDSCEDFHPRQKCSHSGCKQKKEANNSLLLSCAFEKKESVSLANLSHVNISCETDITNNTFDNLDRQLNNPSVVAPKGKRYLVQFKSKVVNYALNHSVKLAAEKFKVNRNTVAEWLTERNRLSGNVPIKHVTREVAGDSEFLAWLEDSKFNLTNELMKQKTQEWLLNGQSSSRQSQWLRMYAHRLNGTEDVAVKKRYIVYPEAFKRAVVFHAQTHSNIAAARVFCVARKRIIEWQQHSAGGVEKRSKSSNSNNVTDEAVDIHVYEWFCKQQPTPTSRQVRNKAVELYRAAGHASIQCGAQWYYRWRARHKLPPSRDQLYANMTPLLVWALSQLDSNKCVTQSALAAQAALLGHGKVSRGWTLRFCKKYSALLQTLPPPETPLPSVLERQVSEYKRKLHEIICTRGIAEDHIIALDEIPLHFLPKDKAKKPLLVRRPGFESCQASLMVSCLADGTLLPTIFVFKGSGPEVSSSRDCRVMTSVNDTGRVSDEVMQQWLSSVCFPHLKGEGVVVLDGFDVHLSPEVSRSVTSHLVHLAVTPLGCAFKLLPVTTFCHSFKAMLEDMCQVWLSSQMAVLESPSPDQLYLWAVRVHKHIAKHCKEKIQSAFKNMILPQPSQYVNS